MLGDLARWLRLLGYDTIYARGFPDSRIVRLALEEGRIIVTRDRGLYLRARRRGAMAVLVRGCDTAERLAHLHRELGVRLYVDPDESRCPICNGTLARVDREFVRGRVPHAVYATYSEFWVCSRCGQVYWRGGHWRGIEATLAKAKSLARQERRRSRC
jgi:uncharacterized protein with PIN domain